MRISRHRSRTGLLAPVLAPVLALALSLVLAGLVTVPASAATRDGGHDRGWCRRHLCPEPITTTVPAASRPLWGGTVFRTGGETYEHAYQRVQAAYDGLDAIRMFFPGLPATWASIDRKVHGTPVVVSFKADPAAVVAGRYDDRFRQWFAEAPRGRVTHWTYWHEPENDEVDLATYRQAWQHLDDLADAAANPDLRSTLILMCWTLSPKSGRDFADYYPGGESIDVLGFDCYNNGRRKGVYRDPASILSPVRAVAEEHGKPWGIAEFGTTVVDTDGGEQGRAEWLRGMADFVRDNGGVFATYFDSFVGFDYRLHDDTSKRAWREIVNSD